MQGLTDLLSSPYAVFDGGVATELYERGFYINRPFEELNASHARDVQGVHESYLDAGAMIVTTNSFSLTSPQLEKFDIKSRQGELLKLAIRIARNAVVAKGDKGKVALSFGPMGALIEPLGPVSKEEVIEEYSRLAREASHEPGFDLYILETFSNLDELESAIEGVRRVDRVRPILAPRMRNHTGVSMLAYSGKR